jgi:GT2 family glycosyltransferase/glycosyltransferase involved in cell wall biosynthesis
MLSITTVCYNTLPIIKKCVDSVFENTTVDFEYILVNNHPPHEGFAEYFDDLKISHSNVAIIDPGKNVGCHEGYNLAFAEAKGDYIVKLDDDTVLPSDKEWAQKMIKAFEKVPDLAYLSADIVESGKVPKQIVKKDYGDGVILEEPKEGFIGTSCAMFPKKIIELFGPFQGKGLYGWEELYYSEQAKKHNLRIAHFPPVKIIHLGRTVESDPAYGLWKFEYGYEITTEPLDEWQQKRDISNYGQFIVDVLRWGCYSETQAREIYNYLKKIQEGDRQEVKDKQEGALELVFYLDGGALQNCGVYRCFQPAQALEEKGLAHSEFFITFNEEPSLNADLYIFQRQRFSYSFQAMMFLKEKGKSVVYEIDDQLFMISPKSQAYPHFSDPEVRHYMEHSIRNADAVTVTTEELKNQLLVYNKNIYVIPNYIDPRYWQVESNNPPIPPLKKGGWEGKGDSLVKGSLSLSPLNKGDSPQFPPYQGGRRGVKNELIIGWGGTATHYDDLELIKGVLESIVDEFDFVKIGFIGYDPGFFKIPENRKIFYQWQNEHQAYVNTLANIDIGLAPLADTVFNCCKSDLKLLEYGILGIPCVASYTGPYVDPIDKGYVLKARNSKDWIKRLRKLVQDKDFYNEQSQKAKELANSRILSDHIEKRFDIYKEIVKGFKDSRGRGFK